MNRLPVRNVRLLTQKRPLPLLLNADWKPAGFQSKDDSGCGSQDCSFGVDTTVALESAGTSCFSTLNASTPELARLFPIKHKDALGPVFLGFLASPLSIHGPQLG